MSNEARPLRVTGHLPGLDGVRGLAILMVMMLHLIGDSTPRTMGQWLVVKAANFGGLGVDLFFVLSGFLITGLLLEAKSQPNYFKNFYARRTLRIFPLYYGTLAALFLILPHLVALPRDLAEAREHQSWLWTYTSNFYIASKSSWSALNYVSHFWSLAVEEHFYLVWPLVVWAFDRKALARISLGVVVAALVLRITLSKYGMSELSISVLTPCRIDALCVGALLALLARRESSADMLVRWGTSATLSIAAATVALSAWCAIAKVGLLTLHQVRNTLYAAFFGGLSLLSLSPKPSIVASAFENRILRFFGKYSYGLYVYHGMLSWYAHDVRVCDRLDVALGNHALAIAATAVLGFAMSTGVAVLSYHLYEKRFLSLKRFFETPERTPSDAPNEAPHLRRARPAGTEGMVDGTDG